MVGAALKMAVNLFLQVTVRFGLKLPRDIVIELSEPNWGCPDVYWVLRGGGVWFGGGGRTLADGASPRANAKSATQSKVYCNDQTSQYPAERGVETLGRVWYSSSKSIGWMEVSVGWRTTNLLGRAGPQWVFTAQRLPVAWFRRRGMYGMGVCFRDMECDFVVFGGLDMCCWGGKRRRFLSGRRSEILTFFA